MPYNFSNATREERIVSAGGVKIFVRSWRPDAPPRALIVICHGVNSHSGQYRWAAEHFVDHGFVVYALDLRGRGRSEGERFYVESIEDYVSDVDATIRLAKYREPGLPVFLLGHSAGGVVACTYTLDHQRELSGLICESFAFRVGAPEFALNLIKGVSNFLPRVPVLRLKNRDFTRDPAALTALENDPLIANEVQPAKTIAALWRADQRLEREFRRITLPVMILHGTADKATEPDGSQFFFNKVGSRDKMLRLYKGHYHDLLNDVGKENVVEEISGWIGRHLRAA